MPVGTCDPATRGEPYNVIQVAAGNGDVFIVIRYGWDNVSVRPDCDGPLVNGTGGGNNWAISYVNAGPITYYLHTIGRNGQARIFTVSPGANGVLTKAQAAALGYVNMSDVVNITLTTTP